MRFPNLTSRLTGRKRKRGRDRSKSVMAGGSRRLGRPMLRLHHCVDSWIFQLSNGRIWVGRADEKGISLLHREGRSMI